MASWTDGKGLAPGKQDRIFDAFYTTKVEGLGMGLLINRTIVEAARRAIVGCLEPGSWCNFQVYSADRGTTGRLFCRMRLRRIDTDFFGKPY